MNTRKEAWKLEGFPGILGWNQWKWKFSHLNHKNPCLSAAVVSTLPLLGIIQYYSSLPSVIIMKQILALLLIPSAVVCLLRNCVTYEEWTKDHINPKCEIVTIYDFDCLAKDQISVQRPQQQKGAAAATKTKPDQTQIICKAPYPIDLDVEGTKMKGFPGIFFTRKSLDNSSTFEYTITVPLLVNLYSPRWWKIFKLSDPAARTEFYLYQPSATDKVLPYDWQSEKQIEFVIVPETRFAIFPCRVTNPKEAGVVKLFKQGNRRKEIPIDNTTLRYDPSIGFILDTVAGVGSISPAPWGAYFCQATNPRTSNNEKFEITLEEAADFVADPPSEAVHSFADRPLTLSCKSKHPISMSGTQNGTAIPKSRFKMTQNDSLLLKYAGELKAPAWELEPDDELQVTCSNELTLNLESRDSVGGSHRWDVQVLEVGKNEILQVTNDGNQVQCQSGAAVSLFNVECPNSAFCRSRRSGIELLGLGQCGLAIDIVRCGTNCDDQPSPTSSSGCLQIAQSGAYTRGRFKCERQGLIYAFDYVNGYDNKTYTDLDSIPPEALIEITIPSTSIIPKSSAKPSAIFVNTTNTFRCRASSFLSNGEFVWKARRPDGSVFSPTPAATRALHDYRKNQDSVWEADIRFEVPVTEIACFVPRWNSGGWVNLSAPLQIREPSRPRITNKGESKRLEIGAVGETLNCQAMGDPPPELQWYRMGIAVTLPFRTYQNEEGEVLEFPTMTPELAGIYECKATSIGGADVGEFVAEAYAPPNITLYVVLGFLFLLLLIILLLVLWWKLRRAKQAIKYLSDEEVNWFKYGNPDAVKAAKEPHEMIINLPFNPEYEITKERLEFDQGDVLGSGAFGVVYKGRLADFPNEVAIKTIKPHSEVSYFKSLLSELKVMIYLGKHENIVQLIGAYTANIKERVLYMVVELSPYGNLENYLRFHQKEFKNLIRDDRICARASTMQEMYANLVRDIRMSATSTSGAPQPLQGLSTADLVDWAYQIANGMTHLEAKKVIHADLATRNILLYENGIVKITDFGLSRQLYAYTNYLKKEQEPLPWRWMALESLREMNFSTQSDVWGYGVTLWEVFSLGAVPYPGLSWSIDFVDKLSQGLRLSRPFYSTTEIYETMVQCWHTDADQRPTFSELRNTFEGIKMRMMDPNQPK